MSTFHIFADDVVIDETWNRKQDGQDLKEGAEISAGWHKLISYY